MSPVALVTGASRGLGFALAKALGAAGWQVVALARTTGGLEELDDAIRAAGGAPATLVPADVTDGAALERLAAALAARHGRLDLLAHAAAVAPPLAPAGHVADRDWDRAMAVNARAADRLAGLFAGLLRSAGHGLALFIDDPLEGKFAGAYAATKAAQRAVVAAFAQECARIGPEVRLFTPPPMPTALRARFFPGEDRGELAPPDTVARRLLAALPRPAPG